jgi:hypothetical protein
LYNVKWADMDVGAVAGLEIWNVAFSECLVEEGERPE